jgi:hypothetical protein
MIGGCRCNPVKTTTTTTIALIINKNRPVIRARGKCRNAMQEK